MFKKAAFACLIAAVSACATPYAPRIPGLAAGYEEEQLGDRTYQVRVGQGWPSDRPNLGKFALYRAAEITLAKGHRFFNIMSSSDFSQSYSIYAPSVSNTTVSGNVVGRTFSGTATTTTTAGGPVSIDAHWSHIDFRLIDESDVKNYERVVDARKVIDDLKFFIDRRRR